MLVVGASLAGADVPAACAESALSTAPDLLRARACMYMSNS